MKTGWLEKMQGDKHTGQYFILFPFFFCTKTKHPLTGMLTQTQSDLCFLPHCSIFSSSITHILTDSSPAGGRLYPNKTKPFCCLPDRIHWRRKALWEKRGVRFRHHWLRGKITSLYVPAGCFHTSTSNTSRNVSDTNSEPLLFILILTHS